MRFLNLIAILNNPCKSIASEAPSMVESRKNGEVENCDSRRKQKLVRMAGQNDHSLLREGSRNHMKYMGFLY